MTAEQALEWLQTIAAISTAVVSDRPLSFSYQEAVKFQEAVKALSAPRVPEETAAKIRGPYNACMFRETCCSLLTAAPAPADDGPVASIDDIWVASGKEYDRSIHSNPDHYAWAELFVSTFPNLRADVDTMAGWFANAMMAKVDSVRARTSAPASADSEKTHGCGYAAGSYCTHCSGHEHCCAAQKTAPADSDPIPMPLFTTTEGDEINRLREREKKLEDVLQKMIGVPASAGFCEPIEGYVNRPHDAVDVMREMAASLRGGSDE
jgi:hypothetical protein